MHTLILLQLLSTLPMTGLVWFVQVVHYPLFARVGEQQFPSYEAAHANRTTWVVAPLMLLELGSSLLLLFPHLRPVSAPSWSVWLGAVLVAVLWLSTAAVQVPLHNRLHRGYSAPQAQRLVTSNWVRTLAWTLRAALVLSWARAL